MHDVTSATAENYTPPSTTNTRLVLASGSPRRRELLALLGVPFEICVTDGEERDDPVPPEVLAALPAFPLDRINHPTLLAWRKTDAAAKESGNAVLLGADTTVVIDNKILNKPRDTADARRMLRQLAGRTHTVYTGVCVAAEAAALYLTLTASQVEIAPLRDDEIAAYVATGEPLDKAGAYGIQGLGGKLVRMVYGSYTAVVGLPLVETVAGLRAAGIQGLNDPEEAYRHWLKMQEKEPLPCPPTQP
ncbi:septum formation protein Maf [Candidatus Gracilibacteria bacterium]|nr:septum formation protein Maf [Candidatus Gracilibacteria bacterium]